MSGAGAADKARTRLAALATPGLFFNSPKEEQMPRRFERHARSRGEYDTPGSRSAEVREAVNEPERCPSYREITPAETRAIEEQTARRAERREARKPAVTHRQGYRRRRAD